MALAVRYVFDRTFITSGQLEQFFGDVDILKFDTTTEIIDFAALPFVKGRINAENVIADIEPVADVLHGAIKRNFLSGEEVADKELDKFLVVLVRSIVI